MHGGRGDSRTTLPSLPRSGSPLIGDGPARGWRHPSAIDKPLAGRGRVCRPSPSHHTHGHGMQLDTTTVGTMSEQVTGRDLSRDAMVVQYVACILVCYVRGQGLAVAFSSRSRRLKIGVRLSVCLVSGSFRSSVSDDEWRGCGGQRLMLYPWNM